MSESNLIAGRFQDRGKALEALMELRRADDADLLNLRGALVLERKADGVLETVEGDDNASGSGAVTGGVVGGLVGLLGGPLGVLFAGGVGALVGAGHDDRKEDERTSALAAFSRTIERGTTVVVAEVDEFRLAVVDDIMARLGGVLTRRSSESVEAEIEAAEDAREAAAEEADRALRLEKKERKQAEKDRKKAEKEHKSAPAAEPVAEQEEAAQPAS